MNKGIFFLATGIAALTASAGASAQASSSPGPQPYIGVSGGYHDLQSVGGPSSGGFIYGVVAGVDVPLGDTLTIGAEGNFHLGSGAIDSEYGIAARVGVPIGGGSLLFVKGGYQEVNFDLTRYTGVANLPSGIDDTNGDYIVGVGGDFALGDGPARLRVGVDTISFDTVRATAGVVFKF